MGALTRFSRSLVNVIVAYAGDEHGQAFLRRIGGFPFAGSVLKDHRLLFSWFHAKRDRSRDTTYVCVSENEATVNWVYGEDGSLVNPDDRANDSVLSPLSTWLAEVRAFLLAAQKVHIGPLGLVATSEMRLGAPDNVRCTSGVCADEDRVYLCHRSQGVTVWNRRTGNLILHIACYAWDCAVCPYNGKNTDGASELFVSTSDNGVVPAGVHAFSWRDGKHLRRLGAPAGGGRSLGQVRR
jgi:hypothetical protein